MKRSHPRSLRAYQGSALDEQDAFVRRQSIGIVTPAPRDKPKRDWRLTIAAVCIGVSLMGLILGAVLALVWP